MTLGASELRRSVFETFEVVGASDDLLSELKDFRSDAKDRRAVSVSSPAFPSGPAAIEEVRADGFGVVDLGVSLFDPGIFDLIEPLRDRADSRVSDFEKEGYESNDGPASVVGVRAPSLFPAVFEGWLPIAKV